MALQSVVLWSVGGVLVGGITGFLHYRQIRKRVAAAQTGHLATTYVREISPADAVEQCEYQNTPNPMILQAITTCLPSKNYYKQTSSSVIFIA
tara:strand:- start:173 stop:451 length:279 start_codon:yes stop_codon:yes gene_type:complete